MLLVSTQFQKYLVKPIEDTIMLMFTKQLTLKCSNGVEAMKKLKKLMKRGCTDDANGRDPDNIGKWNTRKSLQYADEICYLVVHGGGAVLIVNHVGEGNFIERVRDVENYRVNNKGNKSFSYCFRIHNYEQYLHDVGELRAMGYSIKDKWNAYVIGRQNNFKDSYLHVDTGSVELHKHNVGAETVPNLEYIINELPVIKTSKSV